ncbi:MAG TPA: antibiotic biosynthesis monooxygenase [Xanthobacteraceae bacterium]
MFVVIFEVQPKPDLTDEYLKLAQHLKPMLEKIDGFLDVERFASGRTEGRLLSLSTWRDEKALVRWRTHAEHHRVQAKGRSQVFEDYRLRVGEVTTDTQPPEGIAIEQTRLDETAIGAAKVMTITETIVDPKIAAAPDALGSQLEIGPGTAGLVEEEMFASIYSPGKIVLLASWRAAAAAQTWKSTASGGLSRHRHVRIIRDYGMFERREAPQYYPEPART